MNLPPFSVESTEKLDDAWATSHEIIQTLGSLPTPFTECIRSLLAPFDPSIKGSYLTNFSATSENLIFRLLRAPSVRTRMYLVMRLFFPEKVQPRVLYSDVDLLTGYSPAELAALIALIVLSRRIERRADAFYWEKVSPSLYARTEAAICITQAFTGMSLSDALLVGGLRPLAFAVLSATRLLDFQKYFRHLLQTKQFFDFKMEADLFGCLHTHVGAFLLQSVGFGVSPSHSFYTGATIPYFDESSLSPEAKEMRGSTLLLDGLLGTKGLAESTLIDSYPTSDFNLEILTSHIERIKNNGSKNRWLMRKVQED